MSVYTGHRTARMGALSGFLQSEPPEARTVTFECPTHGTQAYKTYKQGGGYKAPYCPVCRAENKLRERFTTEICSEERRRCSELAKMLGLSRPSDFEGKTFESYRPETPEEEKNWASE